MNYGASVGKYPKETEGIHSYCGDFEQINIEIMKDLDPKTVQCLNQRFHGKSLPIGYISLEKKPISESQTSCSD